VDWSNEDSARVLEQARRILSEIGVHCEHAPMRELLSGWGAEPLDERLRFPDVAVDEHLAGMRPTQDEPDMEAPTLTAGGCWAALFYCDPESLEVRPATTPEAIRMARLWDARGIDGVVPLVPGDVPPALVTVAAERIGLIHSRHLGGMLTVTDPEEVRLLRDMNLAAGRRYGLHVQVGISPLRLNSEGLDAVMAFRDDPDVEVHLGGAIPMAGATCPLEPLGALAQSLAEEIALSIVKTVLGQERGSISLRVEPFDFQYSTIVFGSPEWCLYRTLVSEVVRYMTGTTPRSGSFRSNGKQPDEQAACERTASVLWQALLGVRHFGAVGQLSVDEVFSPQQAIIDNEILAYVQRLVRGMPGFDAPGDPVEVIRQGIAEGGFAGLPETSSQFRDMFDFPGLFRHWNVGRWHREGGPSVLAEAWARAQERMAESTYQLEPARAAEVDRLYERAADYLAGS